MLNTRTPNQQMTKKGRTLTKVSRVPPSQIRLLHPTTTTSDNTSPRDLIKTENMDTSPATTTDSQDTEIEIEGPIIEIESTPANDDTDDDTITVVHNIGIRQINKGNEHMLLENLKATFITHEKVGFHIEKTYYQQAFTKLKDVFSKFEPINKFIESDFVVKFEQPEATFQYLNIDNEERTMTFTVPPSYAQRYKAPDPLTTTGRLNRPTTTFNITAIVEVTQQDRGQIYLKPPFPTTAVACDHLIQNVKAIAHFRRHMHPTMVLIKLGESLQQFEFESMGIEFREWPTPFVLPPNGPHDKMMMRKLGLNHKGFPFDKYERDRPRHDRIRRDDRQRHQDPRDQRRRHEEDEQEKTDQPTGQPEKELPQDRRDRPRDDRKRIRTEC